MVWVNGSYFTVSIAQYIPPKSWPLMFLLSERNEDKRDKGSVEKGDTGMKRQDQDQAWRNSKNKNSDSALEKEQEDESTHKPEMEWSHDQFRNQ